MRIYSVLCSVLLLGSVSCLDTKVDNSDFSEKYLAEFDNRTTVSVDITSAVAGEYYAIYYGNPYNEEALVKQPALRGLTPIATTLDVPKDVDELYVVGAGNVAAYKVGNLRIVSANPTAALAAQVSRASDVRTIPAEVITAINSTYFPETTNNVRGENLFKCTDLKIADTPSDKEFEKADVWLTFIGDGGSRYSLLYGKLWFYTYPSDAMATLTLDQCTFYGVKDDEVCEVSYADICAKRNYIFYTKDEFKANVASFKRFKLGEFAKGVNIGFVYVGNGVGNNSCRFTTPNLNPRVAKYTLTYADNKKKFTIEDKCLANGFIRHISVGGFEGNVLGMENRLVTETDKYDGDYNDMLCLVESNPKDIEPAEPVDPDPEDPEVPDIACKTTAGIYLFEDNYPSKGDFDFNDAVIQYEIKDYYQTKNKQKQVTVRALAKGAGMKNQFGFWNNKNFACLYSDLGGYANVYAGESGDLGDGITQTFYGDVEPCLKSGKDVYIYLSNFNTPEYPCVLDIPLSDPDDASWRFLWMQEGESIDKGYYFLQGPDGGKRAADWYRTPKDKTYTYER